MSDDPDQIRALLEAVASVESSQTDRRSLSRMIRLAAAVSHALIRQRIQPTRDDRRFTVWGQEDARGANPTLRRDLQTMAADAERLGRIVAFLEQPPLESQRIQMQSLRLIARYFSFIESNWVVTPGTRKLFDSVRLAIIETLPISPQREATLKAIALPELGSRITSQGKLVETTRGRE